MPVDWDALVLAPLQTAFGEAVTITGSGPDIVLTDAVLDRCYVQVGIGDEGAPITAWQTQLGVRLASGPAGWAPAQGDIVQARGSAWQVVDIQQDGKGHAILVLAVAP